MEQKCWQMRHKYYQTVGADIIRPKPSVKHLQIGNLHKLVVEDDALNVPPQFPSLEGWRAAPGWLRKGDIK